MLTISHISKSYSNTFALNNVSFEVSEGAIMGIIGPNGAGKSTLLDIISGFQNPDEGEICFNDQPVRFFKQKKILFPLCRKILLSTLITLLESL